MKRFLLAALLALSPSPAASAQVTRAEVLRVTALPASCRPNVVYNLTQADGANQPGLYRGNGSGTCTAASTPTAPGGSSGQLQYNNAGAFAGSLFTQSANTIEQYNSTSAQTFRVYNTRTDASNGEWGTLNWADAANVFTVGTKKNGTGATRALQFVVGNTNVANFSTAGHLLFNTDNANDIGASGATRPRNVYAGTKFFSGSPTSTVTTLLSSASVFQFSNTGSASGFAVENTGAAGATAGGGATFVSNPGAALTTGSRLGGVFFGGASAASTIRVTGAITAFASENWVDPTAYGTYFAFETTQDGGVTRAERIRMTQAGGLNFSTHTFGVIGFGSASAPAVTWRTGAGSPEGVVTASVGSLYTRTDGGAGTTLYVKESGSGNTGWIAK